MRKITLAVLSLSFLVACKSQKTTTTKKIATETSVNINLNTIIDDKVQVEMTPIGFTTTSATFHIPKTVPGTYSTDNYGKYIENFKALDASGNELTVTHTDDNSWQIDNAKAISKITYLVN